MYKNTHKGHTDVFPPWPFIWSKYNYIIKKSKRPNLSTMSAIIFACSSCILFWHPFIDLTYNVTELMTQVTEIRQKLVGIKNMLYKHHLEIFEMVC